MEKRQSDKNFKNDYNKSIFLEHPEILINICEICGFAIEPYHEISASNNFICEECHNEN